MKDIETNVKDNPTNQYSSHLDEFLPYLDDLEVSEDQRREFLALIWSIMVQFVDLGFGIDTASQAIAVQFETALRSEVAASEKPKSLTHIFDAAQPKTITKK